MAQLKLVIVPALASKDGRNKVRVAVYHQSQTRYIVQSVVLENDKQFRDGQVIGRPDAGMLNKKLRNKMNEYQDALDKIDPDGYTCSQLKNYLAKNTKAKAFSISQAAQEHIAKKNKKSTIDNYSRTLSYFIDCVGDVPMGMINGEMIETFDRYLAEKKEMSTTTRAMHLRQLKAFINPQIRHGNVIYKSSPFVDLVMPESRERPLDITMDEFKLIRDAQVKEKPLRVAKDLFCLSYYLGGINLIDLVEIDFRKKDVIEYIREKSANTKRGDKIISLAIQPEAKEIIDRWIGHNGKLDFGYSYTYDNFRKYVTAQIRRLAKRLGMEKRVVYYSARKSLVQHGFELGIS
ncbi:MAG: site-specific integrase, partial [Proteiniphilum sp.]|nr:site-specific integrase [Proteiniphilum sp.]